MPPSIPSTWARDSTTSLPAAETMKAGRAASWRASNLGHICGNTRRRHPPLNRLRRDPADQLAGRPQDLAGALVGGSAEAIAQMLYPPAGELAAAADPGLGRDAGELHPGGPRHQGLVQVEEGRAAAQGQLPGTSITTASPWPPPEQMAAHPKPPPRRCRSCTRAPVMREPEAPIGWPRAIAPPWTLTFSSSTPSMRTELRATEAKASV